MIVTVAGKEYTFEPTHEACWIDLSDVADEIVGQWKGTTPEGTIPVYVVATRDQVRMSWGKDWRATVGCFVPGQAPILAAYVITGLDAAYDAWRDAKG